MADYDENAAHVDEDEVDEQKEAETIPRRVRRSSGPGVGKRRKGRSEYIIGHMTVWSCFAWLGFFQLQTRVPLRRRSKSRRRRRRRRRRRNLRA